MRKIKKMSNRYLEKIAAWTRSIPNILKRRDQVSKAAFSAAMDRLQDIPVPTPSALRANKRFVNAIYANDRADSVLKPHMIRQLKEVPK